MFRPLGLFMGLRYLRAKRRNRFISFMSMISMLGISLGVIVLITVLSVMNGFDTQIEQRVFGMANHVTVLQYEGLGQWQNLRQRLLKNNDIAAVAPLVSGQGMLSHAGLVQSSLIIGIQPDLEQNVSILASHMQQGQLTDLKPGTYGMVLGAKLAQHLGLRLGDKVVLVTPRAAVTIVGLVPTFKRFTVVGTFSVGNGFGFDNQYAYINLQDAQHLYAMGDKISGLRLKVKSPYHAPSLASSLAQELGVAYQVTNWTQQFGSLFDAIAMEKNMLFLVLLLIIAVATFNLVSSLVMLVTDKQADIAILRTLGATPLSVMSIFVVQGMAIGVLGVLLGLAGGIALAHNVTAVVDFIQAVLHIQLISPNVYYVDYLPSEIHMTDLLHITSIALVMAFVATLYPAWRAARIQPAEALRYE